MLETTASLKTVLTLLKVPLQAPLDARPKDVVGGAVIGGGFATLYYHRYFPIVFEDSSHVPRAAFASVPSQGSGEEDLVAGAAAASA